MKHGAWVGTARSFLAPGDRLHEVMALEGEGAYEGLSAMLSWKPAKWNKKPGLEGFNLEFHLLEFPDPAPPFSD